MKARDRFARVFAVVLCALLGVVAAPALAAPTVSLTSPASGAKFGAPATVTLTATATPAGGTTITKVEFFRSSTLIGTVTASPYTYVWTNVAIASYSLTAKATASDNSTKTSTARSITVATNVLPTVSLTAPANNASYAAPANITITATATDSDGTVAKVDFYAGSTLLGTDTTSPIPSRGTALRPAATPSPHAPPTTPVA
ncbi:MAG: hypothetical protein IPH30_10395 [Betaproteobacteria bacterium]|nr:hypothetical protein [Betaproteobacteria bacterium]